MTTDIVDFACHNLLCDQKVESRILSAMLFLFACVVGVPGGHVRFSIRKAIL